METNEVWRPVLGAEGLYEVSSHGRVRNNRFIVLSQRPIHGYLKVVLTVNSERKNHRVHKLVLESFVGPRPERMICRHLDGNRVNNHIDNLAWGTNAENQADRIRHGTCNRGTRAPANVLLDSQVLQIFSNERPTRAIAMDYEVNAETVRRIKAGKTWAWLTGASVKTGLCIGSKHRHAKLSEQQVSQIRCDMRTYAEIAVDYGVNQATVGKIKTGKTWRHVYHG